MRIGERSANSLTYSIVLPVYNESAIIESSVRRMEDFLRECYGESSWELIAVDNGSSDDSYKKLKNLEASDENLTALHISVKGVGAALRRGWDQARGDVLGYTDSDLPFHLDNLRMMLEKVLAGSDVVVGSRYMKGGIYETTKLRRFLSKGYIQWINLFLGLRITDNCGTKALSREAYQILRSHCASDDWFFGTELVAWSRLLSLPLTEVPVQCERNDFRTSSVAIITTIIFLLKRSIQLKIEILFMDSMR